MNPRHLPPATTKETTSQVLGVMETEQVIPLGRHVGVVGYFALQSDKLILKKVGRTPARVAYGDVSDLIDKLERQNRGMWLTSNIFLVVGAGMMGAHFAPSIRRHFNSRG